MYDIVIDNNASPLDGKFSKVVGNKLYINRSIYKTLGSVYYSYRLDPNNVPSNIFGKFLKDMNLFYSGPVVDPGLVAINNYLGSLGISKEYPIKSDRIDVSKKIVYTGNIDNLKPIYEGKRNG